MAMRITLLIALAGLILASLLSAAPPATRQASGEETETLVYDISDLVRPRVNYPLGSRSTVGPMMPGGGGGGGGGGGPGPGADDLRARVLAHAQRAGHCRHLPGK